MATSRTASRAAAAARDQILTDLKDDHKRVKKAYKDFQKLDVQDDAEAVEALVQQVLDELTVHAALEEELLYPAARGAVKEEDLIDEAEVEHESMHTFIDQLRSMSPEDEKYAARFTVLCEYVMHHVKEEEREMFPQLENTRLDWEGLAAQMADRRNELTGAGEAGEGEEEGQEDGEGAEMAETAEAAMPQAAGKSAGGSRSRARAS